MFIVMFFKRKKVRLKCDSCSVDAAPVSQDEIEMMKPSLPHWDVVEREEVNMILKSFTFKDFSQALIFTNKVGMLAEKYNHHPEIITSWGNVTVTWWSHGIKGLTLRDLDLAAATEELYKQKSFFK